MALFFFLSGLCSYHSIGKIDTFNDYWDFCKKKFLRILLPCVFVSMVMFQKPCSFWFLLTLFYYFMAFASFHFLCTKLKISRSFAFLFFLLLVIINIPKVGNDQEFIIPFAVGLYLSKIGIMDRIADISKHRLMWIMTIGIAVWLLFLPFYKSFYLNQFNDLLHSHTMYLFCIRQIMYFSFATACCLLFKQYFDKQNRFSWWGGGNFRYVYCSRYDTNNNG